MKTQEVPLSPLPKEKIRDLIFGDYGQCSAMYVLAHLGMVVDGDWTKEDFFDKTKLGLIKNMAEYFERHCKSRNLQIPTEFLPEDIVLMDKIDQLVIELKNSIARRDSLKEIYKIVMRFDSEVGMRMAKIDELE